MYKTLAPWPYFAPDEIEAATRVLQSGKVNYWTGDEGRQFEREFAASAGCRYAIALANGTVALEAALRALGIGPGDEVITTSRTFIASASCAVAVGARPVIADVDRDSQNITADTIKPWLTPKTKAIVAVHLAGWPCDMDSIMELAREHNLYVIEDCAQAQGATYNGRPVGSFGHASAFSFCQDKIMTTAGEGGMLTTNDSQVWDRAWSYKDHGKSYDAVYNRQHPIGFRWLHESFGTNWRMTEVQSAIGRVALRKVPRWVDKRRRYAAILERSFRQIEGLRVPVPPAGVHHAYYKYYAFVEPGQLRRGWDRNRIVEAVLAEGIPCFMGSCSEIYRELAFSGPALAGPLASGQSGQPSALGRRLSGNKTNEREQKRLPVARELGETSLMFLVHPTLSETDIQGTCRVVEQVMTMATSRVMSAGVGRSAIEVPALGD